MLHSITGIVPLAIYLVWHLTTYARALSGEAALGRALSWLARWPWLPAVGTIVIVVPLAFHAAYGITLVAKRRKVGLAKTVQHASGVALLLFLVYHVAQVEVPLLLGRMSPDEIYGVLAYRLSSTSASIPIHAFVYLVAVLAAATHVCIGLHALCVSSRLAATRRSQAVAAGILGAVGLAMFLVGADIVVYFAAGDRAIVPRLIVRARAQEGAACDLLPPVPPAKK
jgi:succinate dehydrogenase/fumarate reductase cytochrome b subunit (b558 family)